jgi:asparagine synthase (glutamine-hydrolysing)
VLAVSAGFPGRANPEAERASAIAKHLGVEHRMVDISDTFVASALPRIIGQLERPSAYENNFARSRIFEQVSSEVSFALTGEGADGMFGGSDTGKVATKYDSEQRFVAWMPWKVRSAIAGLAAQSASPLFQRIHRYMAVGTRQFIREKGTLETVGGANSISATSLIPRLSQIRAKSIRPFYSIYESENPKSVAAICQNRGFHSQNRNQFYCYSKLAAPHGLSVGHPFVAPEVAEIGLNLPDEMKWDGLGTKPILKKLACRYIPSDWIYAKKLGFETPYVEWLRGPLLPMFKMLLEPRTLSRGLFDENVLQSLDLARDRDLIWTAINLELFAREFLDANL